MDPLTLNPHPSEVLSGNEIQYDLIARGHQVIYGAVGRKLSSAVIVRTRQDDHRARDDTLLRFPMRYTLFPEYPPHYADST